MADDGTIAPDATRLARASRGGLRPASPLWTPAVLCLGLALWLRSAGPALLGEWRGLWSAGLAGEVTSAQIFAPLAGLLGSAGATALLVVVLTGRLGWVDPPAAARLGVGPLRSGARDVLACLLPVVAVALFIGVCAGAARAVDADAAGIAALFGRWLDRLLVGAGALLLVAAFVDHLLARRRLWLALHRTSAELRRGDA